MPRDLAEGRPGSAHSTDDDEGDLLVLDGPATCSEDDSAEGFRALACVTVAMIAIGHCQYTWTLFVSSYADALSASTASVQAGFSAFVIFQTGSVLAIGVLLDRSRLRVAMQVGSVLVFLGLFGLSVVSSLMMLWVSCCLMGTGVGCVYNGCVATSVAIFPARRGLVAGVVAAGYGAGSLFTIGPIQSAIGSIGYAPTLRFLSLGVGVTSLVSSCALPPPRIPRRGAATTCGPAEGLPLRRTVREPSFWVLYLMLVLITCVGLVITAQLKPLADAYAVPAASVVLALQIDRVLNGVSRPAWGLISDYIGREVALGLAFGLQAAVLLVWSRLLSVPSAFVVCSALSTFSWGEVYSLFPALAADLYGAQQVSANYGALYTGKGVASILAGPLTSLVVERLGSWEAVVLCMAAASALDSWLALCVLPGLVRGLSAARGGLRDPGAIGIAVK